jgi:hypothetical protein
MAPGKRVAKREKERANGRSYKKGGKIQTGLNEKL